jgi:hypothetical protein
MEIIARLFGLGAAILGAIIFLTVVLVLAAAGLLDDVGRLLVDIFHFLIIDLGGLLVEIVRSLINQLPNSGG